MATKETAMKSILDLMLQLNRIDNLNVDFLRRNENAFEICIKRRRFIVSIYRKYVNNICCIFGGKDFVTGNMPAITKRFPKSIYMKQEK